MAKEKQIGNIHEVTLEAVEEGQMEKDEEKEDEDEDDDEASQLREEEEEEDEGGGTTGEENDLDERVEEDKENEGEADKTSTIQVCLIQVCTFFFAPQSIS